MNNFLRKGRVSVLFLLGILSGCSTIKTVAYGAASDFQEDWNRTSDKQNLDRVVNNLKFGALGEAWKYANKLYFPENRAEALRLIALFERNSQGEFQPRQDTLSKLEVAINEIRNPKKVLHYELFFIELFFQINPEESRKKFKVWEQKIWEISNAQERASFLIRIVSFELETTKDIEAAKKAISVAKNTICMIANKQARALHNNELDLIIESYSNVLCKEIS